ncbi:MAG: response regulator [Sulfitobacter sp.]
MTVRKKILLVEDDPDIREMMLAFLLSEPFDIVEAATIPSARQSLSSEGPFDLAILDFWLGQDHAVSIIDMIRSDEGNTPVIVISGGNDRLDLEATAAIADVSGAVTFLQKPFKKVTLLDAVTAALKV